MLLFLEFLSELDDNIMVSYVVYLYGPHGMDNWSRRHDVSDEVMNSYFLMLNILKTKWDRPTGLISIEDV